MSTNMMFITIFLILPLLVATKQRPSLIKYFIHYDEVKNIAFESHPGIERFAITEFKTPQDSYVRIQFKFEFNDRNCANLGKFIVHAERHSIQDCSANNDHGTNILREACLSGRTKVAVVTHNVAYLQICSYGASKYRVDLRISSQLPMRDYVPDVEQRVKLANMNEEGCGRSTDNRYVNDYQINILPRSMIINGEEAVPNSYPWMVRIIRKAGNMGAHCGGSLINHQWVLTAGHCVGDNENHMGKAEDFFLFMGVHNFSNVQRENVKTCRAEKVIRHERYGDYPVNDIALIKLNCYVEYTSKIRPICLPTNPNDPLNKQNGADIIVSGWGKVGGSIYSNMSPVLKEAFVTTVNNSYFKGEDKNYKDLIYLDGKGENICLGDSGGPMVAYVIDHFVQYGVASWVSSGADKSETCLPTGRSGFTYVPKFMDWILDHIN